MPKNPLFELNLDLSLTWTCLENKARSSDGPTSKPQRRLAVALPQARRGRGGHSLSQEPKESLGHERVCPFRYTFSILLQLVNLFFAANFGDSLECSRSSTVKSKKRYTCPLMFTSPLGSQHFPRGRTHSLPCFWSLSQAIHLWCGPQEGENCLDTTLIIMQCSFITNQKDILNPTVSHVPDYM